MTKAILYVVGCNDDGRTYGTYRAESPEAAIRDMVENEGYSSVEEFETEVSNGKLSAWPL